MLKTYANNAVGTDELDQRVGHGALGVALPVSLDVAQVTDVSGLIRGGSMVFAVGVDYRSGESLVRLLPSDVEHRLAIAAGEAGQVAKLTVRAGRGAAVGIVTKGVNVETTLGIGVVA